MIVQADVPVRDDGETQPGGSERTAGVLGARQHVERERRDERGRELLRIESGARRGKKDRCAVTAQQRERRLVAPFVRARNVIRDLGAERVKDLRAGPLDSLRREGVPEPADGSRSVTSVP